MFQLSGFYCRVTTPRGIYPLKGHLILKEPPSSPVPPGDWPRCALDVQGAGALFEIVICGRRQNFHGFRWESPSFP